MARFHEEEPAVPASVGVLRHGVAEYLHDLGAGDDIVASVQLALSEAITNAIVHGFVDRPEPGTLKVSAYTEDGGLCVVVTDDGSGMKPRTDSPGIGVGLPLMTQLTESLEFRESEGGGTEVAMRFALGQ
jgi:anti-sigma regulatory factor (Ser/Thr protein kinase)